MSARELAARLLPDVIVVKPEGLFVSLADLYLVLQLVEKVVMLKEKFWRK